MGRRKQRVRWTTVEERFFDPNQDQNPSDDEDNCGKMNQDTSSADGRRVRPRMSIDLCQPDAEDNGKHEIRPCGVPDADDAGSNHGSTNTQTSCHSRGSHKGSHCYGKQQNPRTHYHHAPPPPRRRNSERSGNSTWVNAPLAPRFERNKALAAAAGVGGAYYRQCSLDVSINSDGDGSFLESEDLPDGFTKIRSKNLDVLFKKDYYATVAQRVRTDSHSSNPSSEHEEEVNEVTCDALTADTSFCDSQKDKATKDERQKDDEIAEIKEEAVEDDVGVAKMSEEEDKKEKREEEEEEKENEEKTDAKADGTGKSTSINSDAIPFYPRSYQQCQQHVFRSSQPSTASTFFPPASQSAAPAGVKPNLFLYSPASNTIIPCEEIMIPNNSANGESEKRDKNSPPIVYPSNPCLTYPTHQSSGNVTPSGETLSPPPYVNHAQLLPNTMVHYDQYGVPYTSYIPLPPQPATVVPTQSTSPSAQDSVRIRHQTAEASDASSAAASNLTASTMDSTNVAHGSFDLSMYSPSNWVSGCSTLVQPQMEFVSGTSKKTRMLSVMTDFYGGQSQQVYYHYHPRHDYGLPLNEHYHGHPWYRYSQSSSSSDEISPRGGAAYHGHAGHPSYGAQSGGGFGGRQPVSLRAHGHKGIVVVERSTVLSSGGDSVVEDRSEDDVHVACQGQKKSRVFVQGVQKKDDAMDSGAPLIPGLNPERLSNKRIPKKRRKKKSSIALSSKSATVTAAPVVDPSSKKSIPETDTKLVDFSSSEDLCSSSSASVLLRTDSKSEVDIASRVVPSAKLSSAAMSKLLHSSSARSAPLPTDEKGGRETMMRREEDDGEAFAVEETSNEKPAVANDPLSKCREGGNDSTVSVVAEGATSVASCPQKPCDDGGVKPVEGKSKGSIQLKSLAAPDGKKKGSRRLQHQRGKTEVAPSRCFSRSEAAFKGENASACESIATAEKKLYSDVVSKNEQNLLSPLQQRDDVSPRQADGGDETPRNTSQQEESHKVKQFGDSESWHPEAIVSQPEKVPDQVEKKHEDVDGGWEPIARLKKNRKHRGNYRNSGSLSRSCSQTEDVSPPEEEEYLSREESLEPKAQEPGDGGEDESTPTAAPSPVAKKSEGSEMADGAVAQKRTDSAPHFRKSTLRKQKKKKASGLEGGASSDPFFDSLPDLPRNATPASSQTKGHSSTGKPSAPTYATSTRPALIRDGVLDVIASSMACKKFKRASEVMDESRMVHAVQKGHVDTLIISDVGHGICGGPMFMGRLAIGKYAPPDRSSEILPMQQKLLKEAQASSADGGKTGSSRSVVRVLMGEVINTTSEEEEFTETTPVTTEADEGNREGVLIPDSIVPRWETRNAGEDLDLD